MKRMLFVLLAVVMGMNAVSAGDPLLSAKKKEIEKKVDALLKKMTLEEKVGQMTQVTLDVISAGDDGRLDPHTIDAVKLRNAVANHHVGSILNVVKSWYTIDHWHEIITQIQDVAVKETRLGIPVLYGIDAIHGATYTKGSTLFPQAIAVAATWNPGFARKIGEVTAFEVRASGIPWNFHPVLDLGRQPLWPRFWETYGEDVHLTSVLGVEYTRGLMGDDPAVNPKVAPCLKHFAGYSFPLNGKDRTPAWIDERMMREYFLPPFQAAVEAGVPTVMVNSAEINGIPGHANYHLLIEVLKQEWQFDGFVVSDWEDIKRLHARDKVAPTPKEAVRMAVMAGVDMSMVPMDFSFYDLLVELVRENKVPVSRIDDAVRRILRVKYLTGVFDNPYPDKSLINGFASKENEQFNLDVAREAVTVLKNENVLLPLKKNLKVLVTGPTANVLSSLNGGWTITWQGDDETLYPEGKNTIFEAIREMVGKNNATYVPGVGFSEEIDIKAATAAAADADVVVACLGEKAYCETPGNIKDLTLDKAQLDLVAALSSQGKPVIVILTEGRPRIIRRIVDTVQAIVMAYLPGMEGGNAIADVLFGVVNPSGKLPFSYPKFSNDVVSYDCKVSEIVDGNTYDPQFPFGFGLSYTSFEYGDLTTSKKVYSANENITVRVKVKNTGLRAGKEVVQLYVSDLYRSVTPPARQLKSFRKIDLQPGESKTVEFTLVPDDLSFIGRENKRIIEPGTFRVTIDTLSREFELQ